jgi:hypothetical protein
MITVSLNSAYIDYSMECLYERNGHRLKYEILRATDSTDAVEVQVSCATCGKSAQVREQLSDERYVWTVHAYLVGQFDEPCAVPSDELESIVNDVVKQYIGQPADEDVVEDIRLQITASLPTNSPKVRIVQ